VSWVLVFWHVMVHCWVNAWHASKKHVAFIFRDGPWRWRCHIHLKRRKPINLMTHYHISEDKYLYHIMFVCNNLNFIDYFIILYVDYKIM
jgi:hypothetical protein